MPVPDGTSVTFFLSDSSFGSLSTTVSTTANSNGTATTTFIAANKAGSVDVTAVAGGISKTTSIIIAPAATGSIQFVSAVPQIVGIQGSGSQETSIVTFLVVDINGNAVADGTAVTFVMSGPGGGAYITGSVAAPTATSSTVNGYAFVTLHSGTVAGTVTIIASTFVNTGAQTTLSAAIDPAVTTIPVASTSGFASPGKIRIDNELIDYTGTTAVSFTLCTRGAVQTTPLNHLLGTGVYLQSTISTSATQISIGGGVPSAGHWNLATSTYNLAGLRFSGLTAQISAYIADRFGNYNILQGTALNYYPEAGAIISSTVTDASGMSTATLRTQSPDPASVKNAVITPTADLDFADFAPYFGATNEPWRPLLGTTYNPRDGWVTVLATTMGEEAFLDENGNGRFTRSFADNTNPCPAGYSCECDGGVVDGWASVIAPATAVRICNNRSEAFVDIGEPFYDKNDSGRRDTGANSGYPFEAFIDANSSGAYDLPNGLWDGPSCKSTNSACQTSKMIWKDIRLVFSGDYFFWPLPDGEECYSTAAEAPLVCSAAYAGSSRFAIAPANITKGSSGSFAVIVGDRNLNSLPGGTVISASASTGTVTPSSVTVLDWLYTGPSSYGFSVDVPLNATTSYTTITVSIDGVSATTLTVPLIAPSPTITNVTLIGGQVGFPYTEYLYASGGTSPYISWVVTLGSLPPGLTLPSGGFINVIGGTPTAAGTYNFTVQVTDNVGATATKNLSIVIAP
ncbi:MAG: hypothetical protein A2X56_13805 [Nitrospirae bacterium GWC2_57_13]|nr:MAG: hypothetical protein A2X56_13805 [Nitrospirae bacterium GWC2_57_13]